MITIGNTRKDFEDENCNAGPDIKAQLRENLKQCDEEIDELSYENAKLIHELEVANLELGLRWLNDRANEPCYLAPGDEAYRPLTESAKAKLDADMNELVSYIKEKNNEPRF